MEKIRLDVLLREKRITRSRTRAKRLIKKGKVLINGEVITKPSTQVPRDVEIEVTEHLKYASRAGQKLGKALEEFNVDPTGMVVLDVGSSTGGFVDCLLQYGAQKIYAVDVGKDQLLPHLRKNTKVSSMEQTDIRDVENLPEKPELVTVDVSFISLTKVLPKIAELLTPKGEIVALLKPQFEVGENHVDKGGLVRKENRENAIRKIKRWVKEESELETLNIIESPITGRKGGNKEYLLHLRKK